jgi:hypothetical protein
MNYEQFMLVRALVDRLCSALFPSRLLSSWLRRAPSPDQASSILAKFLKISLLYP